MEEKIQTIKGIIDISLRILSDKTRDKETYNLMNTVIADAHTKLSTIYFEQLKDSEKALFHFKEAIKYASIRNN